MTTTSAGPLRHRASRTPATVIAATAVMFGAIALDILTGVSSGLTVFGLGWAEADGANIEVPQYTRNTLRFGFWHPGVWILLRLPLMWFLSRGSEAGRIIAIAVEAIAIAAWAPTLFIWVEGSIGIVEGFDFTPIRIGAGACMAASAAVIVLLCMPATRAWCARR